jgi:hypothetical protein
MTLPDERTRAVHAAREFLLDLLDPTKTPRVPRDIRLRAHSVLRHYPWSSDMTNPRAFDWRTDEQKDYDRTHGFHI